MKISMKVGWAGAVAVLILGGMSSQAAAPYFYWNGSVSTNWHDAGNWTIDRRGESTVNLVPEIGDVAYIDTVPANLPTLSTTEETLTLRVAYSSGKTGILNIVDGADLTVDTNYDRVGNGGHGTVSQSGGTIELNRMQLGNGTTGYGEWNLSGGTFSIKNTATLCGLSGMSLGVGDQGSGIFNLSGGTLITKGGIALGGATSGTGEFNVYGEGLVSCGDNDTTDSGSWYQSSSSTLSATIDSDNGFSLGQIVLFDGSGDNPSVTFEFGAKLDVSFSSADMGDETNSWDLITWPSSTTVTDNGLTFSGDVDLEKWSFNVTDTALRITYGIGTEAGSVTVSSLAALQAAVELSSQSIVMTPGTYNLEDGLPSSSRSIDCSGSNNTIDLTGVYIQVPVGSVSANWFEISGNNNTMIGGEIEDTYRSGLTEVTDFSAFNQDRTDLAKGLGGAAVVKISGSDNLLDGLKLTTRGSFPYGYGSMYGIGAGNTFGLNKRCGILITGGDRNTIDHVEVQHRAFGHGIYIQGGAAGSVIKNTMVEGRLRPFVELYQETHSYDLPYRADYLMPHYDEAPIPTEGLFSLCEDGIRAYSGTGSVTVENCTVKKMRGGIRLYLASSATVRNSTAIDCEWMNFNMPSGGQIINSSGNFSYGVLSDFRLSRNNMDIDWTIIPSPHVEGPHNLADVLGNNHHIVFHRTPGPIDTNLRSIVVSGNNSTITNFTEYPIILEASASGNTIYSHGPVTDSGSGNSVTIVQAAPVSDLGGVMVSNGTHMALSWTAASGASYSIMATTNLVDGPWIEVTNGITGNNDRVTITNAMNEEQQFFYIDLED